MITKRIIPCLDVRDGRVVKGTNFEGIKDVADPVEMARLYNAAGADELVFYDITASFEGRALFTDILTRVAGEIFIPLTVGGGINTLEDFDRVLKCGADKVLSLIHISAAGKAAAEKRPRAARHRAGCGAFRNGGRRFVRGAGAFRRLRGYPFQGGSALPQPRHDRCCSRTDRPSAHAGTGRRQHPVGSDLSR